MSYIALYRKWRPTTFDDVVEQSGVVAILKNAVKQGRIGHAYLFCGTRGTGKTTIAKIFSRAINCLEPVDGNPCNKCEVCRGILDQSLLDVMEIDAASNNGVDNVRDIIEEIAYVPTRAKYKVYIIDEVHMLSTGAFNALLKTLEEPPEHAVFLLATTDPQKLPATILSRCQRFEFRRIGVESIVNRLKMICEDAGTQAESEALYYIAQAADGALRDAISILDQCLAAEENKLTLNSVLNILGIADGKLMEQAAEAVLQRNVENVLLAVDKIIKDGKEITAFTKELITWFRNLLVVKSTGANTVFVNAGEETKKELERLGKNVSIERVIFIIKELSVLEKEIKWSLQKKIILEVGLIKICTENIDEIKQIPGQAGGKETARMANSTEGVQNAPKTAETKDTEKKEGVKTQRNKEEIDVQQQQVQYRAMAKLRPVEEENLREIFLTLKEEKNMMILSYLRNVRALYYSDSVIYMVFCGPAKEIKKESMAKPENISIINDVFRKILKRECVVKLYTDDELCAKEDESKKDDGDIMSRFDKLAEDGMPIEFE